LTVGGDVVMSSLDVGRGVLRAGRRPPRGGFVSVPLDLRDAHGLAALAIITAVVPGTVWCELAPARSALRLHVFHLDNEAVFVAHFKARYECPL
ncbi:Na+/H+ antiporter subunit E, partial [Pseudomonas zeae]|uniref:Na+/H+ antiporter subunit E n=1 Tax=Pseudomonas zeae TaxID=2745510 RepID=UPI003D039F37